MLRVLKFAPEVEVPRPDGGLGPARRVLCAVLLRAADRAAKLAARLEAANVRARARAEAGAAVRPIAPAGALGVQLAEAAVLLALAGYFVAGLVGVLVL